MDVGPPTKCRFDTTEETCQSEFGLFDGALVCVPSAEEEVLRWSSQPRCTSNQISDASSLVELVGQTMTPVLSGSTQTVATSVASGCLTTCGVVRHRSSAALWPAVLVERGLWQRSVLGELLKK